MQVSEYKVIVVRVLSVALAKQFENKVNKAISDGWQPVGGVAYAKRLMMQSMVRRSAN
jgi:hypothetical protein